MSTVSASSNTPGALITLPLHTHRGIIGLNSSVKVCQKCRYFIGRIVGWQCGRQPIGASVLYTLWSDIYKPTCERFNKQKFNDFERSSIDNVLLMKDVILSVKTRAWKGVSWRWNSVLKQLSKSVTGSPHDWTRSIYLARTQSHRPKRTQHSPTSYCYLFT